MWQNEPRSDSHKLKHGQAGIPHWWWRTEQWLEPRLQHTQWAWPVTCHQATTVLLVVLLGLNLSVKYMFNCFCCFQGWSVHYLEVWLKAGSLLVWVNISSEITSMYAAIKDTSWWWLAEIVFFNSQKLNNYLLVTEYNVKHGFYTLL